jgi:tRNA U34 5-methylaminomethyl-2-thiouridine-forming methyltransferase MnmC
MPLIRTGDGSFTVLSEQYGVTYHSRHGAVTESAHIFINAGLRYKAAIQREIAILETGFGTGLNAFMTWLEAERRNLIVRYTALELFPISTDEAHLLDYTTALNAPERQEDFLALHTSDWNRPHFFSDHFSFEKKMASIESYLEPDAFDLIYFDAFAPQAQPELWSADVLAHMYASLKPEGVLVTYCAQGEFKRNLKKVGFTVERLQGPPGKREMTRASRI